MFISIHALREEGDTVPEKSITRSVDFYPRPPRGGRPFHVLILLPSFYISIHALREEGDTYCFLYFSPDLISIHALREEGDG